MGRSSSRAVAPSLLLFAILYGVMVPLGGFLGAKQVSLGSLAVEAGIFPFLTLIAISSGIAELHGRAVADKLVRMGFIPPVPANVLTGFLLQFPHAPRLYRPAKGHFPVLVGPRSSTAGGGTTPQER